ncbi:hypothetical protein KCV87_10005 [Actinosynnema pretiosum subsp. pretiosum]|uniref:Uncharacterized protein n=1 Tax=Actinosynnema pretiosum subsp. pretiosum TaxID=103721 RepID=A0AA45L9X8_9PSEU|nr:hypothetical protein APASM_2035 [Actinosynnema pretiosum subsp. pretiosum]QUF06354.1 hypothetical protein KCV87_10005 [Actinosynnema pretiosum subsp. pretiosum]
MHRSDQQALIRVTEGLGALEAAHTVRDLLAHVPREQLTEALHHLAKVARGTAWALNGVAEGASHLAQDATNTETGPWPELAELAREIETAARSTVDKSRGQRTAFGTAHNTARIAEGGTPPRPDTSGTQLGERAVSHLEHAEALLHHPGHRVTDVSVLRTVTGALERVTDLVAGLADQCARAANRLASRSTDEDAAERHRATARDVATARRLTREVRRELERVHDLAGQLHELTARPARS